MKEKISKLDFIKTRNFYFMYNTKGKPYIKLWTLGNVDVSLEVH